jgi:transposase
MLRIKLDAAGGEGLQALRRDKTLKPAERDRVEMVALSVAGWKVKEIAKHLGYCEETVRRVFRQYRTEGMKALRHELPGPEPDLARRGRIEEMLKQLLAESRTWTAPQLSEALGERGIEMSARQTRRYLSRIASWRRVKRSLSHKQDAVKVAEARQELAVLANERKQAS